MFFYVLDNFRQSEQHNLSLFETFFVIYPWMYWRKDAICSAVYLAYHSDMKQEATLIHNASDYKNRFVDQ